MTKSVALVRAVNVAGHQPVSMADLRAFFEDLGFTDVTTLLQSGNVVFEDRVIPSGPFASLRAGSDREESRAERRRSRLSERDPSPSSRLRMTPGEIERFLEAEAKKRLGLDTDFFVRSADEWRSIVDRNPFPREAKDDPGRLVVATLKDRGKPFDWPGPEIIRVDGRTAYIYYPNGQGRSRLTGAALDKRLGTRATARNWNTVLKLQALLR